MAESERRDAGRAIEKRLGVEPERPDTITHFAAEDAWAIDADGAANSFAENVVN